MIYVVAEKARSLSELGLNDQEAAPGCHTFCHSREAASHDLIHKRLSPSVSLSVFLQLSCSVLTPVKIIKMISKVIWISLSDDPKCGSTLSL